VPSASPKLAKIMRSIASVGVPCSPSTAPAPRAGRGNENGESSTASLYELPVVIDADESWFGSVFEAIHRVFYVREGPQSIGRKAQSDGRPQLQ
jgi:hypothetical protein